jgi:fumarate hydratase subunit beta
VKSYRLETPLREADLCSLRCGDRLFLSGILYTARDAAHQRMIKCLQAGGDPPFPLEGQVIYYCGPSPAPPGRVIGSAGPTTSARLDPFTPLLLARGVKATIGKGSRSCEVREAMLRYHAIYLATTGGAGALLAQSVVEATAVAYAELGPEAIYRLRVESFPTWVVNDLYGGDLYEDGRNNPC